MQKRLFIKNLVILFSNPWLFKLRITILILALLENHQGLTKTTLLFGKLGWNFFYPVLIPKFPTSWNMDHMCPYKLSMLFSAANGQPGVPARELVKPVTDWNDEDRRLDSIDTKARSLIAMSLPDDVFHSDQDQETNESVLQSTDPVH
ncbi:hypothetical protein OSB04_024192 [Centaurea solstitialis]|uniref:Uncharacterized protein n=1 Tax=Centaurea solstitialis TaxID=347529 RepID=A0AA38SKM4_9ASTR|nr:hypothetical protein OSB04_024192 [Centaurea solstitialis]